MTATEEDLQAKQKRSDAAKALMERNFLAWFRMCGVIFPESGNPTGMPVDGKPIKPNYLQKTLQDVFNWFREKELPVRIILLKPRRRGSSTITSGMMFHTLSQSAEGTTGILITGNEKQGKAMVKMMSRYAQYDSFFKERNPCTVSVEGFTMRWQNKSELLHSTLGGKAGLIGGGYQLAWITEEALFDSPSDDNLADAGSRLGDIFKAVANSPSSVIVEESTARGKMGVFYERFTEAESWDSVQANDGFTKDCKRISLFFPFYMFPVEDIPEMTPEEDAAFIENLRSSEQDYFTKVQREVNVTLTGRQMAWRRWALANLCDGSEMNFDRDFPYSVETAFTSSGAPRFAQQGLTLLRGKLPLYTGIKHVNLNIHGDDPYSWTSRITCDRASRPQDARLIIYEDPMPGRRYLVSIDPCEGKTNPTSKDPDHHGGTVWRAGFRDNHGVWHPMKMVARFASMEGTKPVCRWEPNFLEREIFKVARLYGGNNKTMIVVERPIDLGINRVLSDKGCNLYIQRRPNSVDNVETKEFGFVQSTATRPAIIAELAARIMENYSGDDGGVLDGGGIEIPDEWTVRELENFVTKPSGKAEAGVGHDDQVLSTCMAVACIDAATAYAPPVGLVPQFELEDRRWLAKQQGGGRQRW